ncbi:MAG: acyltransferase [Muricoprocola sp.]
MLEITTREQLENMEESNQILGKAPEMVRSRILFDGEDNILYCGENVQLVDSVLEFRGSHSIIFLEENKFPYGLNLVIQKDCAFYMGKDNYINGNMHIILAENQNCVIGAQNNFSLQVWMRTADAHLLYDVETKKRMNASKSIFIGDHVWVGQSCFLLKGTQIDSGSVIGAMSVVANKKISCNTAWAGNPCREVRKGVFWDGDCTNRWGKKRSDLSMDYEAYLGNYRAEQPVDKWIYTYQSQECIEYETIDQELKKRSTAKKKYEYLMQLRENGNKNRFVHKREEERKKGLFAGWKKES